MECFSNIAHLRLSLGYALSLKPVAVDLYTCILFALRLEPKVHCFVQYPWFSGGLELVLAY